jgi:hypothetical protein
MNTRKTQTPLTDDALESRLRAALASQARHDVPDRRVAPHIEWPAREYRVRPRPPWLVPLAAAASVVAVTAAILATQAIGRGNNLPASSGSTTVPATQTSAAPTRLVPIPALPGVTLALPADWTVKDQVLPAGSTPNATTVCLGAGTDCTVTLATPVPGGYPMDVDSEGGFISDPMHCSGEPLTLKLTDYAEVPFGGRASDYRFWTWTCPDGTSHQVAQYVVASPTGYVLSRAVDNGDTWLVRSSKTYSYHIPAAALDAASRSMLTKGNGIRLRSDGTKVTEAVAFSPPSVG